MRAGRVAVQAAGRRPGRRATYDDAVTAPETVGRRAVTAAWDLEGAVDRVRGHLRTIVDERPVDGSGSAGSAGRRTGPCR
jgi:hypothetical protein